VQTDPNLIQATSACSAHARALVEAAKAVSVAGHANIAYHLALLALEELGRRQLIGIQFIAKKRTTDDSPYVERQLQSHVDKLFWCFFSGSFGRDSFLCERMFKPEYQYKKAGIMLSEISPVTHRQGDLLEGEVSSNGKLMLALDALNQRFGRGTVKVSTQGAYQDWQMRQERKSPNYTTSWEECPVA